jgi:hypothetical protein
VLNVPKPELEFADPLAQGEWRAIDEDKTGELEEMILSFDPETGDYTRLLRFPPGADTTINGTLTHTFWEEVWILSGSIVDTRLGAEFRAGTYACRPPGMPHGPWTSKGGAMTLEIRYHRPEPDGR